VFRLGVLSSDILLPSDVVFWQHPLLAPFRQVAGHCCRAALLLDASLGWVVTIARVRKKRHTFFALVECFRGGYDFFQSTIASNVKSDSSRTQLFGVGAQRSNETFELRQRLHQAPSFFLVSVRFYLPILTGPLWPRPSPR
jgi:hypothetical protein